MEERKRNNSGGGWWSVLIRGGASWRSEDKQTKGRVKRNDKVCIVKKAVGEDELAGVGKKRC